MHSPKAAWASAKAPLNRRLRHKSIPCFASWRGLLRVAIAVSTLISKTKKTDRVGHQQRRSVEDGIHDFVVEQIDFINVQQVIVSACQNTAFQPYPLLLNGNSFIDTANHVF
jgi:hypothetical protein